MDVRRAMATLIMACMLAAGLSPLLTVTAASHPGPGGQLEAIVPISGLRVIDGEVQDGLSYLVPGAGTREDPFLIQGLHIEATEGPAILISDSDAHIVIRDCVISGRQQSPGGGSRELIDNDTFTGQTYGIHVQYTTDVEIYNNEIYSNQYGIYIERSDGILVHENDIYDNYVGIYIRSGDGNDIHDNDVYANTVDGIYAQQSQDNIIHNNTIYNNHHGIHLYWGSYGNELRGNAITGNSWAGIIFNWSAERNFVLSNDISGSPRGIYLYWGSDENSVNGNEVHGCQRGIYLEWSSNYNDIEDNHLHNNTLAGIELYRGSAYNNVHNNTVIENDIGVYGNSSDINVIYSNRIVSNPRGIFFNRSDNNLVYDNYLDNPVSNDEYMSTGNVWNTTKDVWWSIVGGPYIGGNYWSNYTGTDNDGDGLGDTDLPHSGVDLLPLVVMPTDTTNPVVTDTTTGSPSTGDPFLLKATATDNRNVVTAEVEYWYDATPHRKADMVLVSGDPMDGDYEADITVPSWATKMTYRITVTDFKGNTAQSPQKLLDVIDNDGPTITDGCGVPVAGSDFIFSFSAEDNVGVATAGVEYEFDGGTNLTATLVDDGTNLTATVPIPGDAYTLNYTATVTDAGGNAASIFGTRIIIDPVPPQVMDTTAPPSTNTPLVFECTVTDNRMVSSVSLRYSFNGAWPMTVSMELDSGAVYIYEVLVPDTAINLTYTMTAIDGSGNMDSVNRSVLVRDVTPPTADVYIGTPYTGDRLSVTINANDNIGIDAVYFIYKFDLDDVVNLTYYSGLSLTVPDNGREMMYQVVVVDVAGNGMRVDGELEVVDNDYPTIVDLTGEPTTGDSFSIRADVDDNVAIDEARLEYWVDGMDHGNVRFDGEHEIMVSNEARTITYTITCSDIAGNTRTYSNTVSVSDNDFPTLTVNAPERVKRTSTFVINATAEDNVGLQRVYAVYWFEEGDTDTVELWRSGDNYIAEIYIPRYEGNLHFIVYAVDYDMNNANSGERVVTFVSSTKDPMESILPWLVLTIVLIAIVLGGVGYMFWRQRNPPQYQPPQPGYTYTPLGQPPPTPPHQPTSTQPQQPPSIQPQGPPTTLTQPPPTPPPQP